MPIATDVCLKAEEGMVPQHSGNDMIRFNKRDSKVKDVLKFLMTLCKPVHEVFLAIV